MLNKSANIAVMVLSSIAMTALLLLKHHDMIELAWSWLIVIGTFTLMVLSMLFVRFNLTYFLKDPN